LNKIDEEEKSSITNRTARPTYPRKKSVLTSEATPLHVHCRRFNAHIGDSATD